MDNCQAERIHWIDIARGIFMLAIVQGHVFTDGVLRWWLYSFHVPAFFFISGYCFKQSETISEFIGKRIRGVVIPYFFFSLLSISVFAVLGYVAPSITDVIEFDVEKNILEMLYANSKPDRMRYNLPLWFLPCLFSVSVLVYCLEVITKRKFKNKYIRGAWLLLFILLGIYFEKHEEIALPWHLETACSMAVWYFLGIITREQGIFERIDHHARSRPQIRRIIGLIAIVVIIAGGILSGLNIRTVGVRNEHYGIIAVYYCSAAVGIIGHIMLSISLGRSQVLEKIGKNTLGILGFHKFPILFFQKIFPLSAKLLVMPNTLGGILCGSAVTIAATFMSLIVAKITMLVFPWALGKER